VKTNMEPTFMDLILGAPYVSWKDGESTTAQIAPFYCTDTLVTAEYVKQHGCNSAGLINLIATISEQPIPGLATKTSYAGSIVAWFDHLSEKGLLEPVSQKWYPSGTLLLRKYRDTDDAGHLAMVYSSGPLLHQKLLHCYPDAGIKIDMTVAESHSWVPEGYYEYASVKWLSS
jgi:hypothetical protein